jgi:hypothetical protein
LTVDEVNWWKGLLAPAGLLAGLHVVYLSRRFQTVAASWSMQDLKTGGVHAVVSALWKLVAILYAFVLHWTWCYRQPHGEWKLGMTILYDIVVSLTIFAVTRWLGPNWYLHLHHYQLGGIPRGPPPLCLSGCHACIGMFSVMLLHGARFESDLLSLFMGQFCAAQFIEGATRWSAAPMWHKRVQSPR